MPPLGCRGRLEASFSLTGLEGSKRTESTRGASRPRVLRAALRVMLGLGLGPRTGQHLAVLDGAAGQLLHLGVLLGVDLARPAGRLDRHRLHRVQRQLLRPRAAPAGFLRDQAKQLPASTAAPAKDS